MTRWIAPAIAAAIVVALAMSGVPALGLALRLAFVLVAAAPVGAVPLLAIARLTGADWSAAAAPTRALVPLVPVAFVAMLAPTGVAIPSHLALWSAPVFVALRAAVAVAALAWAGRRLRTGAGATFAGVTLALYALLVTPIAADWLLPAAPGHPVSAIGMMLFVLQFGAACAIGTARAQGRRRRDLALLLVAAMLGLCYLTFVDYLIIWYGNLPARVPFYLARGGWLALAAMVVGLGGTVAAVVLRREVAAALAASAGVVIFAWWWIGGGWGVVLVALAATVAMAAGAARLVRHG